MTGALLSSEASRLVTKINFSGSICDKLMIQTVKCSPLVDIKFNKGFYDALSSLLFFNNVDYFTLVAECFLKTQKRVKCA